MIDQDATMKKTRCVNAPAARGERKVAVKYGGDCSQLTDMVRATLVIDGGVAEPPKKLTLRFPLR